MVGPVSIAVGAVQLERELHEPVLAVMDIFISEEIDTCITWIGQAEIDVNPPSVVEVADGRFHP